MRKLKENTYLIEHQMQLSLAIDAYYAETKRSAEFVDVRHVEAPESYPYVVVFAEYDEHPVLECTFVTLADFENRGEDAKDHLFEFQLRRIDLTPPYRVRESVYQIPAKDIFKAMVMLGQTHHRDELYDLEVISWKLVR